MSTAIHLIVGLGNPGAQYAATRHNAGFWLADHFADDLSARFAADKGFHGWIAKARIAGVAGHGQPPQTQPLILAKPDTFMNRSGQTVGTLARFYKLAPEEVLVLHDELDLPPGHVKLKRGGGHAGHNGLRDIQSTLGSSDFWRMRLGIGHPRNLGLAQPVINFVLHPPSADEAAAIHTAMQRARAALPDLLRGEFERAIKALHTLPVPASAART